MIIKFVHNHQVEEKKDFEKNQIQAFIFIFELERDERMRFTFHFEWLFCKRNTDLAPETVC